jgi:hypothetical protein
MDGVASEVSSSKLEGAKKRCGLHSGAPGIDKVSMGHLTQSLNGVARIYAQTSTVKRKIKQNLRALLTQQYWDLPFFHPTIVHMLKTWTEWTT